MFIAHLIYIFLKVKGDKIVFVLIQERLYDKKSIITIHIGGSEVVLKAWTLKSDMSYAKGQIIQNNELTWQIMHFPTIILLFQVWFSPSV